MSQGLSILPIVLGIVSRFKYSSHCFRNCFEFKAFFPRFQDYSQCSNEFSKGSSIFPKVLELSLGFNMSLDILKMDVWSINRFYWPLRLLILTPTTSWDLIPALPASQCVNAHTIYLWGLNPGSTHSQSVNPYTLHLWGLNSDSFHLSVR